MCFSSWMSREERGKNEREPASLVSAEFSQRRNCTQTCRCTQSWWLLLLTSLWLVYSKVVRQFGLNKHKLTWIIQVKNLLCSLCEHSIISYTQSGNFEYLLYKHYKKWWGAIHNCRRLTGENAYLFKAELFHIRSEHNTGTFVLKSNLWHTIFKWNEMEL